MITLVCLCNLAIALLNLFVAWRVWKLRRFLIIVTRTLTEVEQTVHRLLFPAPAVILKGQAGTRLLGDRTQKLGLLRQQTLSMLRIVNLVYGTWRQQSGLIRFSRLSKKRHTLR